MPVLIRIRSMKWVRYVYILKYAFNNRGIGVCDRSYEDIGVSV